MGSASNLALNPEDCEIDSRVVYYELETESLGPTWAQQVSAALAFQQALSARTD